MYIYIFILFFAFFPIHAITSCKMPKGQITEQYTRPNKRVRTTNTAKTIKEKPNRFAFFYRNIFIFLIEF